MAPCAIGTDTGGSVRIPAAWNGITGLKTTIGRISTFGVLPLSPTLDTPGPITRDVEDAALLLAVLQGKDRRDRRTSGVHDVEPMADLHRGVAGLRLARLPNNERDGIDVEVLAAYDRSVDALASLGAEIVDLVLPASFADLGAINGRIMSAEAYAALAELVEDNSQPLDQDVRPRVRAGATISLRDYLCVSAWKKDPLGGVIGVQKGPLQDRGSRWLPKRLGGFGRGCWLWRRSRKSGERISLKRKRSRRSAAIFACHGKWYARCCARGRRSFATREANSRCRGLDRGRIILIGCWRKTRRSRTGSV
jgi:hypothetical protein